jgi:diketogulonate reductase-like aldo/keto reductase
MEKNLNDGNRIPIVGFGTYKANEEEGIKSIQSALTLGYRLIDTAAIYQNEEAVGKAIKTSGVVRQEIFITTKLWRENLGYKQTRMALDESLRKLDLNYIDLYLIHWPANTINYKDWKKTNADTWRAMEELQAEGKIKSLGVSNFWPEHLEALFQSAKVTPSVNQIEFHPGYWQPQVTEFCKSHGIAVESWSPLARGKVFGNDLLIGLSKKYQKSVSQVCLRWIIQSDVIAIPKSSSPERIKENIDLFDFELSKEEMKKINGLPQLGFSGELPNIWPERI